MPTIAESRVALLETKIVKARIEQLATRQAWARCPSAENVQAEEAAQARVDELLDRWVAMRGSDAGA